MKYIYLGLISCLVIFGLGIFYTTYAADNIILNAGFENLDEEWILSSNGAQYTDLQKHSGTYSGQIWNAKTPDIDGYFNQIGLLIQPGTYDLTFWTKFTTALSRTGTLSVYLCEYYESESERGGMEEDSIEIDPCLEAKTLIWTETRNTAQDWTEHTFEVTFHEDYNKANIFFESSGTNYLSNYPSWYVDDTSLIMQEIPTYSSVIIPSYLDHTRSIYRQIFMLVLLLGLITFALYKYVY